jgi:uncharacterized membrane protein
MTAPTTRRLASRLLPGICVCGFGCVAMALITRTMIPAMAASSVRY